jgi:hypothetical protein
MAKLRRRTGARPWWRTGVGRSDAPRVASPAHQSCSASALLFLSSSPRPKRDIFRSPTKFVIPNPPPADSSHPRHHNLPISIQERALGPPKLNLHENRGYRGLHCWRSSNLRPSGRDGAAWKGGDSEIVGPPPVTWNKGGEDAAPPVTPCGRGRGCRASFLCRQNARTNRYAESETSK